MENVLDSPPTITRVGTVAGAQITGGRGGHVPFKLRIAGDRGEPRGTVAHGNMFLQTSS